MATLGDVAKRAGVSVSTASRILSSSAQFPFSFKEETRERVLQASRELGYTPNLAARALVSGKTQIVGVVFPRVYDSPFTALFALQILADIEEHSSRLGYQVLISSPRLTQQGIDASFLNLLQSCYLDGVIIQDDFTAFSALEPVLAHQIPAVVLGYRPHEYFIRGDDFAGGALMAAHVLESGHQHIGVIGLREGEHLAADVRLRGISYTIEQTGLPPLPIAYGDFSKNSGSAAAQILLDHNSDLTALLVLNDRMAMGAIMQARAMGLRVPQDLTVVGYDDLPQSAEFSPPLTTVSHHAGAWGEIAVNMLLSLLGGENPDPVELSTELVERASSAPPRAAAINS